MQDGPFPRSSGNVNWVGPDQHIETAGSTPQAVKAGRDAHVRTDHEVTVTLGSYPNTVERTIMAVRNLLAIVVLLIVIVLAGTVWATLSSLGDKPSGTVPISICEDAPELCPEGN